MAYVVRFQKYRFFNAWISDFGLERRLSVPDCRGDVAYRPFFEALAKSVRLSDAWIVTSMPRGGLQIVQPGTVREDLIRGYAREWHAEDAMTWRAIAEHRTVRAVECWPPGEFAGSNYSQGFLHLGHFGFAAAAPVDSPVFSGYPGALQVYRAAELGDFNHSELQILEQAGKQAQVLAATARAGRAEPAHLKPPTWMHRPHGRLFAFDSKLRACLPVGGSGVGTRVIEQMLVDAKERFKTVDVAEPGNRFSVADSNGELRTFHVVQFGLYPALGEGPILFYCLEPDCWDWHVLRAADFAADSELSRLMPAMQFMRDHFARGPSLDEVAKTVHLSPFHFHRRFTELLGITPKHFLLDWQICQAKLHLIMGEKDLVEISKLCGFAHQSHFTSRFKQATGLTPTRWRRLALRPPTTPPGSVSSPAAS
jgi:AraC-like DNA-binding protein